MRIHVQIEKRPGFSRVRHLRLHAATVVPPVDGLQSGEVQGPVVGHEDPLVLLDKFREGVAGPVVLHVREVVGGVAVDRLAPVLVAGLRGALQHELEDEAEVQLHALRDYRAELVRRFAVVGCAVQSL